MCSNASYRGVPSGTNWTRCCHGTGKRPKLWKPTTPRSVCVQSFAQHRGCRATGTDHPKAQVDPPFCIVPPGDHTPPKPSNVGHVQRLRIAEYFAMIITPLISSCPSASSARNAFTERVQIAQPMSAVSGGGRLTRDGLGDSPSEWLHATDWSHGLNRKGNGPLPVHCVIDVWH